ncbi:MAG: polysaccharide biosynthesis/export family protein [Bacteroidales bacterium]
MKIKNFVWALTALLLASCGAPKNIPYLVDIDKMSPEQLQSYTQIYEAKIVAKDVLTISVHTTTPEAGAPFNLGSNIGSMLPDQRQTSVGGTKLQTYIVDNEGYINYPIIGKIKLLGLTRKEAEEKIKGEIHPSYITEVPIVNVRFENYKVSVLGEVNRPGQYTVENEQCTIFDALAKAGDLTIYGKRKNVMLIREDSKGNKEITRIDLQNPADVLNPANYYLQQNDVIYVEPSEKRAKDAEIGKTETFTITIISTLITITNFLLTILR